MKRNLYIFLIIILCFTCAKVEAKSNTIYLRECEYTDEYKRWLKLSEEERAKTIAPSMCVSSGNDKFALLGSSNAFNSVSVNDTKFDLRGYGYVTDVKNQGDTGSCWAFATNASIESNLLINGKGTYDLSEAHLELATQKTHEYNRLTFSRKIDTGGNYYISSAYLRNNWGPVLESNLPFNRLVDLYKNNNKIEESLVLNNKAILDVNSISMFGNDGSCDNVTIQDIKEYLITNGAITSTAYYGNTSSFNLHQYYDGASYLDIEGNTVSKNQLANHAVTIVGWDDTISKDSFLTDVKPSRDGAFIVKNSYGVKQEIMGITEYKELIYNSNTEMFNQNGIYSSSDIPTDLALNNIELALGLEAGQLKLENNKIVIYVGDNGYQYISYDDIYICNNLVGFFGVDTEVEDYAYGYDDFGLAGMVDVKQGTVAYLASIFQKQSNLDEELKEINVYFTEVGQRYEIYFADNETKDVNSSTLVASGTSKFTGYNTIKIDNVKITSDKYSIIIKVVGNNTLSLGITMKNALSIDSPFANVQFSKGVQYLSIDGIEFADVTTGGTPFHLLVKAYTNEINIDNNEDLPKDEEDKPNSGEDNPKDDDKESGNDEKFPADEKLPGDEENKDNTNDDGKIEILPSGTSNKNDINDDESSVPNPNTGDFGFYIFLIPFVVIGVGILSRFKLKKVK